MVLNGNLYIFQRSVGILNYDVYQLIFSSLETFPTQSFTDKRAKFLVCS